MLSCNYEFPCGSDFFSNLIQFPLLVGEGTNIFTLEITLEKAKRRGRLKERANLCDLGILRWVLAVGCSVVMLWCRLAQIGPTQQSDLNPKVPFQTWRSDQVRFHWAQSTNMSCQSMQISQVIFLVWITELALLSCSKSFNCHKWSSTAQNMQLLQILISFEGHVLKSAQ